jgi:hypothetical protein
MSIIAIMQPTYLPWIGYFDLMDQVDMFVFFDDVKVSKQSWGVRNRIKTKQGEAYIGVPLRNYKNHFNRFFLNTEINYDQKWQIKHLKTIAQSYSKSLFFKDIYQDCEGFLNATYKSIGDLNIELIVSIAQKIGIKTKHIRSSEINNIEGRKDHRLVNICHALGADQYLSPQGSAVYIESNSPGGAFPEADIELFYHNYEHPIYPQQGSDFFSHMCILDLLMNCGYEQALKIIRSGRRPMIPFQKFRKNMLAVE